MATLNPDLSKPTCRVCLQSNREEEMSSIFESDVDFCDVHIYEKIEQCAGIKVLRNEKMPTLICGDCYGVLKVSYKFRIICRNSNQYLKEFVALETASQNIEIPIKENPLLISENSSKRKSKHSQYKKIIKDNTGAISESIGNNSVSFPPNLNSDDYIDSNISEENCDNCEVFLDIDYEPDQDVVSCCEKVEVFIENIELDENEEVPKVKTNAKCRKKLNLNKRNYGATPSKILGISSDGTAVIHENKFRTRKMKKEKQPHICEVCGNIYQRRYALELHMRRHREEKPFECEICGYAFHSNFELIRHMRKHTGSRPYKCSYCTRAFGDQSTLIKHERIHRNERPFKCDTCEKSFTYSNVLKHHKLTHTGEKPYTCELCGKCFTRPHHLRAHLETLQHQNDPRSKLLLQNIKKNTGDESLKVDNFTINI